MSAFRCAARGSTRSAGSRRMPANRCPPNPFKDQRMYLDKFKLTGKVAVVTGAARGIGLATVEALAEAGAAVVVITDMNPGLLRGAVAAMTEKGYRVEGELLDVTD